MSDTMDDFLMRRQPTAARPLLGLTILLVEDSRFASEAVRLMCLRSGARIRRADSLAAAHKHMRSYRPSVVIVDLGLPDGPGESLIADLVSAANPVQVILATSGDPDGRDRALAAKAQGFLDKPISSLAAFQQAILDHLPEDSQPAGLRTLPEETVTPDKIAYRDDMAHVAELLPDPKRAIAFEDCPIDYVAQFIAGVARSAQDAPLLAAAEGISLLQQGAGAGPEDLEHLRKMVLDRLDRTAAL